MLQITTCTRPSCQDIASPDGHVLLLFAAVATFTAQPIRLNSVDISWANPADEQPQDPTLLESILAVWLTIKLVYPFLAAAFIPPLVTASVLPMIFGLDFSKVSTMDSRAVSA
jgi:hypothetical protein